MCLRMRWLDGKQHLSGGIPGRLEHCNSRSASCCWRGPPIAVVFMWCAVQQSSGFPVAAPPGIGPLTCDFIMCTCKCM